jgi:gluconolactonase
MTQRTMLGDGLGWPEGPTVLPDGAVAFVETYRSRISVWSPSTGIREHAFTGGGPNAVVAGPDGSLFLTQNGGIVGPWRAAQQRPPSIQRVSPSGKVEILATTCGGRTLIAPNDLAFGPDGRLYFTDPAGPYDPVARANVGFLHALNPDGTGETLAALPPTFPNGIAVEDDGSVVWVESYTRAVRRLRADGRIEDLCILPEGMIPDGFKITADGDFYIAVLTAGGCAVVGSDGTFKSLFPVGDIPTNCAFAGSTLYVTDAGRTTGLTTETDFSGQLWAAEVAGVTGQTLHRGWTA